MTGADKRFTSIMSSNQNVKDESAGYVSVQNTNHDYTTVIRSKKANQNNSEAKF